MKKYWLILLLGLIPINVNADSIGITCSPDPITVGNNITCSITGTSSASINGVNATFSLSNGLTFVSYNKSTGWDGSFSSSTNKFVQYISSSNAKTGNFGIGTLVVKANTSQTSYTIGINSIEFSDISYNAITVSGNSDTVYVSSSDNDLKSLTVNSGTLSPSFSAGTTSYTISNYTGTSIIISAVANSSSASVTGTGTKSVNYGTNTYSIIVTAQSGSTKTYKIVVTRPDTRSSDASLKTLTIDSGTLSPSFNSSTTKYSVSNFSGTSITVSATANDSKASITGTGKKTISATTTISVVVTAENGTKKTYTITVTKGLNSDLRLQYLTVSNTDISYSDAIDEYNLIVNNEVSSININGDVKSIYSSISGIGEKNINVGLNTFNVIVTSQSGSTRTIKITVTRKDASSSTTSGIKSIVINNATFNFNEEQLSYDINVSKDTDKLDINYDANPNYTVTIIGNDNLVSGNNVVSVNVTNTNTNEVKTYTINVHKDGSSSINNQTSTSFEQPFLIVSIICGIETVCILFMIYKKFKKNKIPTI